ncbi:thiosulfate/3-mercaptopyruvate sulfurtransferase [Halanaerobium congolense]|jgi:thiosulfate/3-mercaptopyruvate sulfurtransferase|uniref:thiosulfate sulfurtransferase n=1 Tax=Halanaerobium congolense TaxID=54121 RepID=A0A1M7KA41_9FIRM|nr:rhodanese-like domain-containing protein [Halanaerobium congolense]KXS48145.1 MAG: thiosulfate/3-mercaptopyruvate sulfurtransferase [Halanaerobium sp. T82-1]PTX17854.1 thiosulfate/3-mercaptopyruvate sulfurtransferase [Halanaerobium congolense]PXV63475.1 thiosulfate/3-mercaptopyruvate sulfurtransferase [Halanaerobium congolense]TDP19129.1 thiosulfate/3-mercaptopyruvate sulfurtransferase [Halanaerobium congolense]SDF53035.1 thiosulfate/3-mercaptopyruvate sulfurtransferase [Halanaerobium congo
MKKTAKLLLLLLTFAIILTGCEADISVPGEVGQDIITADEALKMIEEGEVVVVDAQQSGDFEDQHLDGAVNIARNDITTFGPYPNMLADASKVESSLGENGISNQTKVLIYDNNNNMDAARLWWTMLVYGHDTANMKVISGGLNALKEAGANFVSGDYEVEAVEYKAAEKNEELIAAKEEVLAEVNNPSENVEILDVRTAAEVNKGIIPGAIHINYVNNNKDNGEFYPPSYIQRYYPDNGITPDEEVIMYCQTSIRAAQSFIALHNAGYRDLKLYDGAWIEWSSDSSTPKAVPTGAPAKPSAQDGS